MTYEDLAKVNETLATMDIKGKSYVLVNARVMAFRRLYPEGKITTEIVDMHDGIVTMKATVTNDEDVTLATGFAYEKETSSYINKTSYIENCETSAVGRALGFLGIGIDTSIASYEEVQNAVNNQGKPDKYAKYKTVNLSDDEVANLREELKKVGWSETEVMAFYKVGSLGEITQEDYMQLLVNIDENGRKAKPNNSRHRN